MAQTDALKKYLDAGMAFTSLTRSRAEQVVKDLVAAGELQRNQAKGAIDELLDRSRKNADTLADQVRKEVDSQLASLGLVRKADLVRLEAELAELKGSGSKAGTEMKAERAEPPTERKAPVKAEKQAGGPSDQKPGRGPAKKPSGSGPAGASGELPARRVGPVESGSGKKAPAKKASAGAPAGVSGELPAKRVGQSEKGAGGVKPAPKKTAKKQG